ncbi:TFIIH complex serine/threonine-protein kinase subunit kin28 [Coniothyrium glycines]
MTRSPAVLSPRPNPPGATKARALALLNSKPGPAPAIASSAAIDGGQDLAEQINNEVREQFVQIKQIGEGTYANVFSAHYRHDPSALVAIKRIKLNAEFTDGIALDAIREIKFLSELSHPNIIKLHAVFSTKEQNLSLVLEYLPRGDLEQLWQTRDITYGSADIKAWANMLCRGIWFCHQNQILHRDIKGSNALIAADGTVKLADFGLARGFADPGKSMTTLVITRNYRPPELYYGCRHYGGAVDMWSIGVTIADLTVREFFFPSMTDIDQLNLIQDLCGIPTEESWPGVSTLEFYVPPGKGTAAKPPKPLSYWRARFPLLGDDGIDFLRGLLTMDPKKRLTARQALEHKYWTNLPRPTKNENLPKKGGGEKKMGEDLKRKGGEPPAALNGRGDKVARKLDFGNM